jgi:hypothetical protein
MTILTFPMPLDDFFGNLRVQSMTFDLGETLSQSRTAGGDVLTADMGERLWRISVTLVPATHAEQSEIEARLDVLREAGRTLLVYPKHRPAPRIDPLGAFLGTAAPSLAAVSADRRQITLSGLPVGYALSAGDFLSFTYGSGRRALHRVVTGAAAGQNGTTPWIEVSPAVRLGFATPSPVTLVRPVCKAVLVPGSVRVSTAQGVNSAGASFSMIQTLR